MSYDDEAETHLKIFNDYKKQGLNDQEAEERSYDDFLRIWVTPLYRLLNDK